MGKKDWLICGFMMLLITSPSIGMCIWMCSRPSPPPPIKIEAKATDEGDDVPTILALCHDELVMPARYQLKADEVRLAYWKDLLVRHTELAQSRTIRQGLYEETRLSHDLAIIQVELDNRLLREAEARFKLIEEGVRRGRINTKDLVFRTK